VNPKILITAAKKLSNNSKSFLPEVKKGYNKHVKSVVNDVKRDVRAKGKATMQDVSDSLLSKNGLATTGLVGTAGLMVADKKELVDLDSDGVKTGAAIIGTVGGALLAAGLGARGMKTVAQKLTRGKASKGDFRSRVDLLRNNLQPDAFHNFALPFYGGGVATQLMSVVTEMAMASGRAGRRFFNPKESYASKISGLPQHMANDITTYEKAVKSAQQQIADIDPNLYMGKGAAKEAEYYKEIKDIIRPVSQAEKPLHAKMINDYINPAIFKDKPRQALSKYAEKFVKEVDYRDLQKTHRTTIGPKALDNLIKAQGLKPGAGNKYFELTGAGMRMGGDVLRGIQFDARAYNLFKRAQDAGMSRADFIKGAKEAFGDNAVIPLTNNKVQILLSPSRKPNIDWGGYAGTIVWDKTKPGKVAFMADDLRDLFGVKLGANVLNTSQSKIISIPEILESVEDRVLKAGKGVASGNKKDMDELVDAVKEGKKTSTFKVTKMSKGDFENLLSIRDKHIKAYGSKIPLEEKIDFTATRLGAIGASGGTVAGAYALATDD
jgi:hypothetical protein